MTCLTPFRSAGWVKVTDTPAQAELEDLPWVSQKLTDGAVRPLAETLHTGTAAAPGKTDGSRPVSSIEDSMKQFEMAIGATPDPKRLDSFRGLDPRKDLRPRSHKDSLTTTPNKTPAMAASPQKGTPKQVGRSPASSEDRALCQGCP